MIDPIFNMFKTKFAVLDRIKLLNDTSTRVDIFIDLEMVFKVLLTSRNNNYLKSTKENEVKLSLISNIINLAQHYRLYCSQPKFRKDSRIYLFWNYTKSSYLNKEYIGNYRDYYDHKIRNNLGCEYILRCLDECVPMLKKIISYVNQVYLIDGFEIESAMIPMIVESDISNNMGSESVQKIIISNSKYLYQYVNHGFTVLDCDKDDSIVITQENCISILKHKMRLTTNKYIIPSNMIPFAVSLIGDKYRNIPKLAGVGLATILKVVDTAINAVLITENTTDINSLSSILSESYQDQFRNNYRCTEINLQYLLIRPIYIVAIENQIIDKFDDDNLRKLNEQFFQLHPIMMINTKTDQIMSNQSSEIMWNK